MNKVHCIFCEDLIDPFPPPPEHIIPENIGGSRNTVLYNVCKTCNHKLGSEVDAELIGHRHIFDTFKKLDKNTRPDLDFKFKKAYYFDNEGNKIKLSNRFKSPGILPTLISQDRIICSKYDKYTIGHWIKKQLIDVLRLGEDEHQQVICEINEFRKRAKVGEVYNNEQYGIKIENTIESNIVATNEMSGKTPHRFLAKACVEFAYGLGIADNIGNLNAINEHAIKGGLENIGIQVYEELLKNAEAKLLHIIKYTQNQFQFCFFQSYIGALDISWIDKPAQIAIALDIERGNLVQCEVNESSRHGVANRKQRIELIGSSPRHFA